MANSKEDLSVLASVSSDWRESAACSSHSFSATWSRFAWELPTSEPLSAMVLSEVAESSRFELREGRSKPSSTVASSLCTASAILAARLGLSRASPRAADTALGR